MTILLLVFLTAVIAGLGFWFYNRRQINSLTEILEDKNAVINSFREHLSPAETETHTLDVSTSTSSTISGGEPGVAVVENKPEKKKKKYYNNQKKDTSSSKQQPKQRQNSEKSNKPNKPRKPKTQQ